MVTELRWYWYDLELGHDSPNEMERSYVHAMRTSGRNLWFETYDLELMSLSSVVREDFGVDTRVREPAAVLPVPAGAVHVLRALRRVGHAAQDHAQALKVDRLEDPAVHPEVVHVLALRLEQRGGDGEDRDAPVQLVGEPALGRLAVLLERADALGGFVAVQEGHSARQNDDQSGRWMKT